MKLGIEQTCLTIALDVNFGEVVSAINLFDIPEVAEQDLDVVFKVSGFGSENPADKKVLSLTLFVGACLFSLH